MPSHSERLHRELAFQTLQANKDRDALTRASDALVERYRVCRNWRTNRVECVVRFLTMGNPKHICDFGCGSGEMACRLGRMGYRVTGLDVSPELIELARDRARLEEVEDKVDFIVGDAAGKSLPLGRFDAVLAMSVLHHLPLEEGLTMLDSLLEPGGCIAFQEPVAGSFGLQWLRDWVPVKKDVSPDERQLSASEVRRLGERFQVVELRHFHLLTRLLRVVPPGLANVSYSVLSRMDRAMLQFSFMQRFAGIIVLRARKRS